jgi:hypothetical protein
MSDTDARAEIARPRHVARFSSGAYCVVAPIPAREAKYFRVKYQNGLPRFTCPVSTSAIAIRVTRRHFNGGRSQC